jgi:hypothetical protein
MNISNFNYVDIIYLVVLILFSISFGIKGATKSISYSLKIILSVSIPFIFFKRILIYSLEMIDSEYLNSLNKNNSIFLEIISFIVIFLSTYIIFSLVEKALNLKSPSQLEFKILDIIIGAIYGIFLFSIIFYFVYIAFLKNHIEAKNMIMKYNISIYQNLMYKDIETENNQDKKSSKKNKDNEKDKLY